MKRVSPAPPHGVTVWFALILLTLFVAGLLCSGCGRIKPPGQGFVGKPVSTSVGGSTSPEPIPNPPFFEAGPPKAKVRVVAYYAMDKKNKPLMDQMKAFAKQYGDKIYVRFVDIRSPLGQSEREASGGQSEGVLINGQGSVVIQAKPQPHPVNFDLDLGRYWTLEDLRAAVDQAVSKAYPK
jgi:hypothetical protein